MQQILYRVTEEKKIGVVVELLRRIHYFIYKRLQLNPTLSQTNQIHKPPTSLRPILK
jgi:hypothetical protein